ncbi:uncharacterized protein LOC126900018 [Daktulosphaira vitifoliae]|uniref:uncharacterized protein LOC126900018 n=1 Tax=Daktulosphaira vitifoliae TaxID=58002 RepID=UPI0021A9AF56|nr:uncharacterized protein LOC126900018 [Daktulosphaira vitifoliae]XP_050531323.1 uncharacterized protein LOC126900018 [Daktulosphaira vitifoliae]
MTMMSVEHLEGNTDSTDDPSDSIYIEFLGEPLAKHGSCTFYKAMRYKTSKNTNLVKNENVNQDLDSKSDDELIWNNVLLNKFYAVRPWNDSDTVCIGELELLWQDDAAKEKDDYGDDSSSSSNDGINKRGCSISESLNGKSSGTYNAEQLASLRLYIMPDQTPTGRCSTHGEDEVLEITDRVVLRVKDMVSWIRGATNNDADENIVSKINIPTNFSDSIKQKNNYDLAIKNENNKLNNDDKTELNTEEKFCTIIKTETIEETDGQKSKEKVEDNLQIIPLLACAIDYADVADNDKNKSGKSCDNKRKNSNNSTIEITNNLLCLSSTTEDIVVMSYSRYCRYRALLKRFEEILKPKEPNENDTKNIDEHNEKSLILLKNRLVVNVLGGGDFYTDEISNKTHQSNMNKNIKRVLFCRDTFDYPELETHEMLCNHLAPKLKGPSFRWNRVKAMAASSAAAAAAAQESSDESDESDSQRECYESSTDSEISIRLDINKKGRFPASVNVANGSAITNTQNKKSNPGITITSNFAKNLQYIEQKLNGVAAVPITQSYGSSKRRKLQHPQQIIQQQYQHQYQIRNQLIQQQYQQRFLQQHIPQQKLGPSSTNNHMSSVSREQLNLVDALRQGGLEVTPIVVHSSNHPDNSRSTHIKRRYSNSSSNCTFDGEDNEDDEVNIITVTPDVVCILNKNSNSSTESKTGMSTPLASSNISAKCNKKNLTTECATLSIETSISSSVNTNNDNKTIPLHRKINQAIDSLKEQIHENDSGSISSISHRHRGHNRLSNGSMSECNAATNWLLNNDNITVAVLNSPSPNINKGSNSYHRPNQSNQQVLDLTSNHKKNNNSHQNSLFASSGAIDLALNKQNRSVTNQASHHHNVGSNLEITIVPITAAQQQQRPLSKSHTYNNPSSSVKPSLTVRQQLQQRSNNSNVSSSSNNNRQKQKLQNQRKTTSATANTSAALLQQEYLSNLYGQLLQRQSYEALAAAFNNPQQQQLFLLAAAAQQAQQQAQVQQNKNNSNKGGNKD